MLFAEAGTEVLIRGILPGIKNFSGEKIQWYLASELRDRIRHSGASIRVVDRTARAEYKVEPRQFEGRLLHELPAVLPPQGDVYAELYLAEPHDRRGWRLLVPARGCWRISRRYPRLRAQRPGQSRYVQGIIDVAVPEPHARHAPRASFRMGAGAWPTDSPPLEPLAAHVNGLIEAQQHAEEEQASQQSLRTIQRAFHEAMLALPPEEYDWFDIQSRARREQGSRAPDYDPESGIRRIATGQQ